MPRACWLAIGATLGALAITHLDARLAIAACAAAAAACLLTASRAPLRMRVAAIAVAGGVALVLVRAIVGWALTAEPPHDRRGADDGRHAEHQALVLSVGAPAGGLQRGVVELRPPAPPSRVYVWLPRYPPVAPGDLIVFTAALEPAPTEGGFGDYLARSGIALTARSRVLERVGADGSPLAALEGVRRGAARLLTLVLPEPQAGLSAAMAIGVRDTVAREVNDEFRLSGLSHVVAISGWHIALLGAVVGGLLGGIGRRPRSVVVLTAICCYAVLAGASPSVIRAAVMASVVLLARESGRRGQAPAALALTCLVMLVADPATVDDIGFQLSAVATAGLLAWAARLRQWLAQRLPARAPGWLLEALAVSLAAQAATLPLVLFHFGRLSTVAPLANLLVAPLVAPAMLLIAVSLAAGALVAAGLPALVLAPVALLGTVAVGAMIAVADVTAALPYASLELPPPFNLAGAAGSVALLAYLSRRRPKRPARATPPPDTRRRATQPIGVAPRNGNRVVLAGGALALSVLLAIVYVARPDGRLHVTVLDVGQGDAILLQGPHGGRALIDTGPDPDRLLTLLDARVAAWDRRLDVVVLTHPHEDHVAGLALLLDRYRIGEIVEPGMVGPGAGDAAYRRRLAELGRETRVAAAGDRLWLDGIALDVHWPVRGTVPLRPANSGAAINNVSIVLELRYGGRRMLFTGDVEEEIDAQLLAAGVGTAGSAPLDVLKVAHHGSGTATTDEFVERLRPRVAVVSAGLDNPYGHPSPATIARLVERGATVYRTDLDGSIEITTDGRDLVTHAVRGRPAPAPRTRSPEVALGFCPLPTQAGGRRRPTYNRGDGRSRPRAGGRAAAPLRSTGVARRSFLGDGGSSGIPPRAARGQRRATGRQACRGRRAAA